MISDTITKEIAKALKEKDEIRLSTLRMLSSALHYEKIALQRELNEKEEIRVVQREIKKRKDAIEAYEKAGAKDRAETEKKESEILAEYLPEQMNSAQVEKIVDETIKELSANSISEMGKVMGMLVPKLEGRADNKMVSELVREKLSGN